jgi:hypothetical protein
MEQRDGFFDRVVGLHPLLRRLASLKGRLAALACTR